MKQFSTFNPEADEVIMRGHGAADALLTGILSKVNEIVPGEGTHKLHAAIVMAGSPLKYIATAIAHGQNADEKLEKCGKETMLVAALLAARCMIPNGESMIINFSGRNFLAALNAASGIAQEDLTPFMDEQMVAIYSDGVKEENLTLGYWDYIEDVVPSFENFGDEISKFAKNFTKH